MMTSPKTLTMLGCQIKIPKIISRADKKKHLQESVKKVTTQLKTTSKSVDLVVLPELSSLNYSRETFSNLSTLAEPLEGISFNTWRMVAIEYGVFVSYGFARAGNGRPYICNAVVDPKGQLKGYYDKLHLAQYGASMEKEYFKRGNHLFIFEVNGFKIAPIICYDIRVPELCRTLVVDQNVDLILHCGAYYRDSSFHSWHSFVVARALENQVFFLSLNRAGKCFGNSIFCLPWQDQKTPPLQFYDTKEDFQIITLDRQDLLKARTEYTFLKDRLENYKIDLINA